MFLQCLVAQSLMLSMHLHHLHYQAVLKELQVLLVLQELEEQLVLLVQRVL
jgi:hypothetical protein